MAEYVSVYVYVCMRVWIRQMCARRVCVRLCRVCRCVLNVCLFMAVSACAFDVFVFVCVNYMYSCKYVCVCVNVSVSGCGWV